MKNLRKLSRNDLKDLKGGGPFQMSTDISGNCWVHEKNGTLTGGSSDYGQSGGGKCPAPPSGYHCKTFTAMGGC
jgi:hypothetical protein